MPALSNQDDPAGAGMRLDKWLWASRLCKSRALAVQWLERGRVEVDGVRAKPGRTLRVGNVLRLAAPPGPSRELTVRALSAVRGPAPVAQALYQESAASLAARQAWLAQCRGAAEPAANRSDGRPTKRDRRAIDSAAGRWTRWSASVDD